MARFKTKFYAHTDNSEEAAFNGVGKLFDFQGYRFLEGTDSNDEPRYIIADYTVNPKSPVFYELELTDFYRLIAYYLIGLQPDKAHANDTLLGELEQMTGRRESYFK